MNKPETKNGMTFEMAMTQVEGSKYKVLGGFKQFVDDTITWQDLESEADVAIVRAWNDWDPEKAKWNTHVTNMINWHLGRWMDQNHPVFMMTVMTKNDLKSHRGETFASIKKAGKTKDVDFNKEHGLDGTKPFSRELWNKYVYKYNTKQFGSGVQTITNQSNCKAPMVDDDSGFDILDHRAVDPDEITDTMKVEWSVDAENFDSVKKTVAKMLLAGESIDTIAKAVGMSKFKMCKKFGFDLREHNAEEKRQKKEKKHPVAL